MPEHPPKPTQLLAASISIMLACAGLGAFGGCYIDMVEVARGGTSGASWMMLFGAIGGGLIGLAVSRWDKPEAKHPSPIRRRFALRLGYACLWLLVAVLSSRADWRKAHNWIPVDVPIRFDRKNTVSAAFTADAGDTYDVQIDLKRNLPYEDLSAFTGSSLAPFGKPAHNVPPRPEINWTVTDVREADRAEDWRDQYWGESVGLKIGHFKAVRGRRYTVTASVTAPSPAAQVLDPHLRVALTYTLEPQYYAAAAYAFTGGMIAAVVGVALMVRAIIALRAELRENHHELDPD